MSDEAWVRAMADAEDQHGAFPGVSGRMGSPAVPKTPAELRALDQAMWKHIPATGRSYGRSEEVGVLSAVEVRDILASIAAYRLVCELTVVGFSFGRIGLRLYLDEPYPGVGPDYLFCLSEDHLDPKDFPWVKDATFGGVHEQAWVLFGAAHEPRNIERLQALGLKVRDRFSLSY